MNTNSRLSDRPYRRVVEDVETQFDFIRFCIRSMPFKAQKEFFKQCYEKGMAQWEKDKAQWTPEMIAKLKESGIEIDPSKFYEDKENEKTTKRLLRERYDLKRREKQPKKTMELWLGSSETSLNQSELLLLVAHFESFMKVIHETFLRVCAEKVFQRKYRGKPNVSFGVQEIFADGCTSKFRRELIIKEVKWLDTQDIEVRIDYFKEHFGVSFGLPTELQKLIKLMEMRNKVTHEIYLAPTKEAQAGGEHPLVVTEADICDARLLFKRIPSECVKIGEKQYPAYFDWMG